MRQIKRKTDKMTDIETKKGVDIEEILRSMYVDENKSAKSISKELNISYVTTLKWLKLAGIYSRRLRVGSDT